MNDFLPLGVHFSQPDFAWATKPAALWIPGVSGGPRRHVHTVFDWGTRSSRSRAETEMIREGREVIRGRACRGPPQGVPVVGSIGLPEIHTPLPRKGQGEITSPAM